MTQHPRPTIRAVRPELAAVIAVLLGVGSCGLTYGAFEDLGMPYLMPIAAVLLAAGVFRFLVRADQLGATDAERDRTERRAAIAAVITATVAGGGVGAFLSSHFVEKDLAPTDNGLGIFGALVGAVFGAFVVLAMRRKRPAHDDTADEV